MVNIFPSNIIITVNAKRNASTGKTEKFLNLQYKSNKYVTFISKLILESSYDSETILHFADGPIKTRFRMIVISQHQKNLSEFD